MKGTFLRLESFKERMMIENGEKTTCWFRELFRFTNLPWLLASIKTVQSDSKWIQAKYRIVSDEFLEQVPIWYYQTKALVQKAFFAHFRGSKIELQILKHLSGWWAICQKSR